MSDSRPGVVELAPVDPKLLLTVVDFVLHRYDDMVDTARGEGFEPMLTLPRELVDARGRVLEEIVRQASAAAAEAQATVAPRLVVDDDLVAVIRWYWMRSNLFAMVAREGMPEEWRAGIEMFRALVHSAAEQLPPDVLRL